jgi:hypothetical protein
MYVFINQIASLVLPEVPEFEAYFERGCISHIVKHFQYVKNPLDIKKMSVRPGVRTQGSAQLRSIHATYKQSL